MNADKFWAFMLERERIRLSRMNGFPPDDWTNDPIFKKYSFTNVKRDHDRTTYLLKEEFYDHHMLVHPSPVALLNAALFRFHGRIETARAIGWHAGWEPEDHVKVNLKNMVRMFKKEKVFTSAYIIPSCGDTRPKYEVVTDIIDGIWTTASSILNTTHWSVACDRLCRCWGVGQFMAKEVLLDYRIITGWTPTDWETWTPVGPGARRGAGVVKYDKVKGIPAFEALEVCRELYSQRDEYWPSDFVALDLTDIQFQLCEFAKYEKARRDVGRPKRRFQPTLDHVTRRNKQ